MQPIWPRLAAMKLNTVLTPIAWESIEPQEGKFDFTLVDGLINGAKQNDLRIVFLWFGSWKNTFSSYVPEWVKRDTKRFPRVQLRDGRNTERLTPLNDANLKADARAFSALMKHIHDVDSAHTVLMIQVENEVGVLPDSRDRSQVADAAFNAPVPKELMDYVQKHADTLQPELSRAWRNAGRQTAGNWQQVFGSNNFTDDLFMAWQYAKYIHAVTAAGKAEYPIPMYTNAALIRPNYQPGQYNSGGPLPHSFDVWKAAGTALDFLSPDIYFDDFAHWAGEYSLPDNPLFVPEAKPGATAAANAFFAIGQLDAIGFSPFNIDGGSAYGVDELGNTQDKKQERDPIGATYAILSHLAPLILEKQGSDQLGAMLLEGEAQREGRIPIGNYMMSIARARPISDPTRDNRNAVMFLQSGADEYIIAGYGNSNVTFQPYSDGPPSAGIASIDEEVFANGKWIWERRLNGDENSQGQGLKVASPESGRIAVYRVRLYRY
jgi:hypothetical protein